MPSRDIGEAALALRQAALKLRAIDFKAGNDNQWTSATFLACLKLKLTPSLVVAVCFIITYLPGHDEA